MASVVRIGFFGAGGIAQHHLNHLKEIPEALVAAVCERKAGVMSQVGYSLRYLGSAIRLKEFLKDKPVGSAHCFRWGGLPGVPWWRKYDQGGGQLVEMTTHQVDLLRWVMGEVEAVSASY